MPTLTNEQRQALAEQARLELARRSYREYVATAHHGNYKHFPHTDLLFDALQPIAEGEQKHILIEMPPRHGKCLVKGTKVVMSDGRTENIENIHRHDMVKSVNACYNVSSEKVTNTYNNGVKPVIEIELLSGRKVVCTENHPLLTVHGWKKAGELSVDDSIAAVKKTGSSNEDVLESGFPYLLGILLGDGSYLNEEINLSHGDEGPVNKVRSIVEKKGWDLRKRGDHDFSICGVEHVQGKKSPRQIITSYLGKKGSYDKRVPDIFYSASEKEIGEFIGGFFDADGHVNNNRSGTAELYSVSKELLSAIQELLFKTGIYSYLRMKKGRYNSEEHISYRLVIDGQDLITFGEKVFLCGKKKERLNKIVEDQMNKRHFPEYESIPGGWKDYKKKSASYYKVYHNIRVDKKYKRGTARHLVREVAKIEDNDYLKKLCNPDIIWERIVNIKYIGNKPTYDIEVEQTHNFLVNSGIVSHNSMGVTETFPSYFIAKNPDKQVIAAAYSDTLARKFGRLNRNKFYEFGESLFGLSVSQDSSASNSWSVSGHSGGMIATGIGSSITGAGADCLIIDDPVKNAEEANSPTMRDKVWDEWESTLSTRLHYGASVIVIMTRWHEDDFIGRLLERSPRNWERLRLPAIAEDDDDLLGRKPGEPLCRGLGFDEEWAEEKKREVGSQVWASLYQQRPSPPEGGIINRNWWYFYKQTPKRFDEILQSWDCTFKDTDGSDFVVGQVWGRIGADKYLLDQVRDRMDLPGTMQAIRTLSSKWPEARAKLIEDKANGSAVMQMLKREISGLIPVEPEGGKMVRLQGVSPDIEAGNVYLPDPSIAPWVHDFIEEVSAFPYGPHDDQVDAMSQALTRMMNRKSSLLDRYKKMR